MPHRALAAGVSLSMVAAPAVASASERWYAEGRHVVEVERIPGDATGPDVPRPGMTRVTLRYPAIGREVRALVDDTAIVRLEPGAEGVLEELGLQPVRELMPSVGLWLVRGAPSDDGVDLAVRVREAGARARGVLHAAPNLYRRVRAKGSDTFTPDDPRFPGQWFFENLKMTEAWGLEKGKPSTSIVVVDTGCDLAHPDLAPKLDPGLDVVDGDSDPSFDPAYPGAEHGTACAGLVAAQTDNGEGIAGACPECRLRCVRMLAEQSVPTSAVIEIFDFAFDVDASIVSNSWGYVDPAPVQQGLADAINHVFDAGRGGKGALVLFAMGNDGREVLDHEIEAVRGVLGIGAINNFDEQTPFTNSGNSVDLVSPTGTLTTDITGALGADPTDYMTLFGGTSSSCPVVAGIAGLLVGAAPERTAQELYDVMIATARPAPLAVPDENGHDPVFGFGIVDPVAALHAVLDADPPDAGATSSTGGGSGGGSGESGPSGDESTSDGGCSCTAVGAGGGAFVGYGLAALALLRARRRRRGSVLTKRGDRRVSVERS